VPCLTATGTLGIVDIEEGIAWDTGVVADAGVADLGLAPLVHQISKTRGGSGAAAATMPAGWQQIQLPPWRGFVPGPRYKEAPSELYRPEHWIRPRLVQTGLQTCYGRVGSGTGEFLDDSCGWDSRFPWGVPEWVQGTSVTVLDVIADGPYEDVVGPRTRRPRGTDAEELRVARGALERAVEVTRRELHATAHLLEAFFYEREIREAADALPKLPTDRVRAMLTAVGNSRNWAGVLARNCLDQLAIAGDALDRQCPWEVMQALSHCPSFAAAILPKERTP
jgi:hypothetical protein